MLNLKPFLPFYSHLSKFKALFATGIISGFIYAATSGFGLPFMVKTVFPLLFEDGERDSVPEWLKVWVKENFADSQHGLLIVVCLMLPFIMLIRASSAFINGYCMTYVGMGVVQEIQKNIYNKIQQFPLSFFSTYKSGDLVARILSDPAFIKKIVVDTSNDLIKQPATFIAALGFISYSAFHSPAVKSALVGALVIPICVFPIRKIGKYVAKRSRESVHLSAQLNADTIESIQSPMEIRAYNLQQKHINSFNEKLKKLFKLTIKQTRSSISLSPIIEFVTTLGLAFSLYLGVKSGMTWGEFFGLAVALYMAYEPLKKLGKINTAVSAALGPLERMVKILDFANSVPEPINPLEISEKTKGHVRFRNVNFHYQQANQAALKNINVEIQPGEIIALVGHSGAGKTTFANLIPRFHDVTQGEVLLDGVNIKDYRKHDLRQQIALVPQTPMLFNQNIRENIRIGKHDATDEEVVEAAKQAYAHEFILKKEQGYDSLVEERGNALSGGQRQRIALARAFLKDAPILIMDEATSALDNDSEYMIQKALQTLSKDRTVFMIAHRFSSLKNATRTFYFESSKLVATGTHDELYATEKGYRELYGKSLAT